MRRLPPWFGYLGSTGTHRMLSNTRPCESMMCTSWERYWVLAKWGKSIGPNTVALARVSLKALFHTLTV